MPCIDPGKPEFIAKIDKYNAKIKDANNQLGGSRKSMK
jgi:hypothetical protein